MRDGRTAERVHLDALTYRMLGGLLILGAGLLLGLVLLLLALPQVETASGSLRMLPGTGGRHGISEAALPVLGAGILVLGVPGLLALAFGRRQARFGSAAHGTFRLRSLRRPALVLLGGVAMLAVVLLRR